MRKLLISMICFAGCAFIRESAKAQLPSLMLPTGHEGPVVELVQSRNGAIIASTSTDKTLKIWESNTGRLLRTIRGYYTSIRLTDEGRYLCADSMGGICKVWDLPEHQLIFRSPTGKHCSIGLDATNNQVAIVYPDSLVIHKNLSMKDGIVLNGRYNSYASPSFSADGKKLVYSATGESYTTDICMMDIEQQKVLSTISTGFIQVFDCRFLNNEYCLLDFSGELRIMDFTTKSMLFSVGSLKENSSYDIDPTGTFLITAQENGNVNYYDMLHKGASHLLTNMAGIKEVSVSRNSQSVLLASENNITTWNPFSGKKESDFTLPGRMSRITLARQSNEEKHIIIAADNEFCIYDIEQFNQPLQRFSGKIRNIDFAVFDPGSSKIYSRIFNPRKQADDKVFSLQQGKLITRLQETNWVINPFSADGRILVQYPKTHYSGKPVTLINANTGTPEKTLPSNTEGYGIYSPDGKLFFLPESDGSGSYFWNATSYEKLYPLSPADREAYGIINPEFSHDSRKLLFQDQAGKIRVYDAQNGKLLFTLTTNDGPPSFVAFSANDSLIITGTNKGNFATWNAKTGKQVKVIRLPDGKMPYAANILLSRFNQIVIPEAENKALLVYDLTGKLAPYSLQASKPLSAFLLSPDERKLYVSFYGNDSLHVYNLGDGKTIAVIPGNFSEVSALSNLPLHGYLAVGHSDGLFDCWDITKGKCIARSQEHQSAIKKLVPSPNDSLVLSISDDCTMKLWSADNGHLLLTVTSIDSTYLTLTPDGYYMSNRSAGRLLHYENKMKSVGFEQLDIRYNRPDRVTGYLGQLFGGYDSIRVAAYYNAYLKRIRKTNTDTLAFTGKYSVPESRITNNNEIRNIQTDSVLSIRVHHADVKRELDHMNLWVNEVPVFGVRGIDLKQRHLIAFDTTFRISLSEGENRIQTSVTNISGIESYRVPLFVKYSPAKPAIEKTWFIGIGINRFHDPQFNLQWSVKDIRDLATSLKNRIPDFSIIDTLFDERCTLENIQRLKSALLQTGINDKVIIAYSGHGLLNNNLDYFLSAFNVDFLQPEKNGVPYETLENLFDSIPARKKLLLIDACHSGEVDKEEVVAMQQVQAKLDPGNKGIIKLHKKDGQLAGMKNSFELMQELFLNVNKSTGTTIISAAAGTQFALERSNLKNGVFTYSILEAMQQNNSISVNQLKKIVSERVPQLTNGLQQPTFRNELQEVDWEVW